MLLDPMRRMASSVVHSFGRYGHPVASTPAVCICGWPIHPYRRPVSCSAGEKGWWGYSYCLSLGTQVCVDVVTDKAVMMLLQGGLLHVQHPGFGVGENCIRHVTEVRHLGIAMGECMRFHVHVDRVREKLTAVVLKVRRILWNDWDSEGVPLEPYTMNCSLFAQRLVHLFGMVRWWLLLVDVRFYLSTTCSLGMYPNLSYVVSRYNAVPRWCSTPWLEGDTLQYHFQNQEETATSCAWMGCFLWSRK